jgi:multiple antibiotic resistance protein
MAEFLKAFVLCFIPIAVAIDAISLVPIYMTLTAGFAAQEQKRIIIQSFVTSIVVGVVFLVAGKGLLRVMGIKQADFQIAGGIVLLGLAIPDILGRPLIRRDVSGLTVGVVPLGMPLMVGPGVLTASLLLSDRYGYAPTIAALVVNLVIAVTGFWFSRGIIRVIGEAGTKALTKLVGLLLAAYAVMLVRDGIQKALTLGGG